MAKIVIPKNMEGLLKLSTTIIIKHETENSKSPLQVINMEEFKSLTSELKDQYELLVKYKRQYEDLRDQIQITMGIHRNQKMLEPNTIRYYNVQIRDILKGVYINDIQHLEEWGFEVVRSNRDLLNEKL